MVVMVYCSARCWRKEYMHELPSLSEYATR
jgi:hypothetical protein